MNPEDIKILIERLLESGEILATKAYALALKQVYVEIFQSFIYAAIFASLAYISYRLFNLAKEEREEAFIFLSAVSMVIFSIFVLWNVGDAVSMLMNPEWYAVENLLQLFPINR